MGKKKKKKLKSDISDIFDSYELLNELDDEDDFDFDFEHSSDYESIKNYEESEEDKLGGFRDMINVDTSNIMSTFKPVNNMMLRMWPRDISEKEMKKALKKVKKSEELTRDELRNEGIRQEYYLLKDGKTLTNKEKDLITRINALRLTQNNTIIKIVEKDITPDIIEKVKKDYKIYECDYTDSKLGSMALKSEGFLDYIKGHDVKEIFLSKEKCIYVSDYDGSDTNGYEELTKDMKTYKKILKKITDNVVTFYMLSCFVDGLLIRTRVDTKFANTIDLWNEVYGLHKDEVMRNSSENEGFGNGNGFGGM